MSSHRWIRFVAVLFLVVPTIARAQSTTTGSIAGSVKDTTGAVLPGVTVEASSPALIEKVRSVVTDGAGEYKITDLRPGTFTVTFTLPGFATVKREGIELTAGFTAAINAELKVGTVQETIVVSGLTPVVDVQNVRTQRVLTRDVIDTIPTAKAVANLGVLVPGMVLNKGSGNGQDVGGSAGETFQQLSIHGGRKNDQMTLLDGMSLGYISSFAGGILPASLGDGSIDQTVLTISGNSAESDSGGVIANLIPKQGGNQFHGTMFGIFANDSMQSDNYTDDLKAKGLAKPLPIKQLSDFNPSIGGPLVKDRLWFFGSYRDLRANTFLDPSVRGFNISTTGWTFVPDLNTSVVNITKTYDAMGRATWQINPKNQVSALYDFNKKDEPFVTFTLTSAEASFIQKYPTHIVQATWSAPVTSRLLFQAGFGYSNMYHPARAQSYARFPAATELSTGITFRAPVYLTPQLPQIPRDEYQYAHTLRGSVSYVTGSHAFKFGGSYFAGNVDVSFFSGADYEVGVLNGAPNTVTYYPTPFRQNDYIARGGLYAQDQWTLHRFTFNVGLRYDHGGTHYPDYQLAPTNLLPARSFSGADVLSWNDLSPRLGVAWDVFGNGKTALKANASRYITMSDMIAVTRTVDPINASGGLLTRTWNDVNRDFIPQGDPLNPAANGELGPSPNANFGKPVFSVTYDPNWSQGFGTREYDWEFSGSIQQEIIPGMSLNAGYFRRIYGNFAVTDNALVAASDYDSFCVTAPLDPRLPGGGGNQICGYRDLNPSKLGRVQNVGRNNNDYGNQIEHFNGVDFAVNARLHNGTLLQGGVSTGRTVWDNCAVFAQIPETGTNGVAGALAGPFCHQQSPFLTQFKLLGSYTLPWQLQVAGTFQSVPGDVITATYVATNAEVVPTLGRNLSAGPTATVSVPLITPNTVFNDRINQVDLRFSRVFKVGMTRIKGMLDVYNVGNISAPLFWSNTYGRNGATWLRPSAIVPGRLFKVGAQIDF